MTTRIKCRICDNETDTYQSKLPEGWWYTKAKDELQSPRGQPTCSKCLHLVHLVLDRRELYED